MTYVSPKWIRWILPAYAAGGLAMGLLLPAMKNFANARWGRAGIAIFLIINFILPVFVIAMAAIYPRLGTAAVGGLLAIFGFLFASGIPIPPLSVNWLKDLVGQMGPIVSMATIAYLVLGTVTVLVLRPVRRVGYAADSHSCSCGYLLIGCTSDRCPECGEVRRT